MLVWGAGNSNPFRNLGCSGVMVSCLEVARVHFKVLLKGLGWVTGLFFFICLWCIELFEFADALWLSLI